MLPSRARAVVRRHARHLGWVLEWLGPVGMARCGQLYLSEDEARRMAQQCGAGEVEEGEPLDEATEGLVEWRPRIS